MSSCHNNTILSTKISISTHNIIAKNKYIYIYIIKLPIYLTGNCGLWTTNYVNSKCMTTKILMMSNTTIIELPHFFSNRMFW